MAEDINIADNPYSPLEPTPVVPGLLTNSRGSATAESPYNFPPEFGGQQQDPEFIPGILTGNGTGPTQEVNQIDFSGLSDYLSSDEAQAREQANIRANDNNPEDWRFRVRLAPGSQVLYKSGDSGLLDPLKATDGVIFPYTPQVIVNYQADYNKTTPTHSNYAQYFYQSSQITDIQLTGTFTAQSTKEADYLLAAIHFFKSATKMFYGQDANRGTPPPMVFLDGHGENQFNDHPCVIQQFNYVLPPDVDYVRTSGSNNQTVNLQNDRTQQNGYQSPIARLFQLFSGGVTKGAENRYYGGNQGNLAQADSSYVPTKIELTMTLHPIVSRKRASQEFSVADYAQGQGVRRGFW